MTHPRPSSRRTLAALLAVGAIAFVSPLVGSRGARATIPFSIDAEYTARFERDYTTQFPSRWTNQARGTAWRTAHDAAANFIRDRWEELLAPLAGEGAFSELRPFNFSDPTGTQPDNVDPIGFSGPENNVLAFVPGSDPALRSQVVIVGGHYDCVDVTVDGGLDCGMQIPITTAVLEALVRYWTANDVRPRRSFAAFAIDGEEQCLCGSVHYTSVGSVNALAEHLELPAALSVAAYHDTDMMGANYPNRLFGLSSNDFMPLNVFSAPALEDPTRALAPFAAYQSAVANPAFLARFRLYRRAIETQRDRFFADFHRKYPTWTYRDGVTKPLFTDEQKKYVNIVDDPLDRSDHTVFIVQGVPADINIGLSDPTAAPPGWVPYHHVGEAMEDVHLARGGTMSAGRDALLGYEATSAWIAYISGAGEDSDPALGPFFLGETAPSTLPGIEGVRLGAPTAVLPEASDPATPGAWAARGLTDTIVRRLTIDPRDPATLYAATQERGFMVSRDAGRSWTESNAGLEPFTSLWSVDPDPVVANRLWASTHHGGVYRSDDGGAHWRHTHAAFAGKAADATFAAPSNPVDSRDLLRDNAAIDQKNAAAGGMWLYVYDQCLASHAPGDQDCATRADWPARGFDAHPPVVDAYRYASEVAVMGDGSVLGAGFNTYMTGGGIFRSTSAGARWTYGWKNPAGEEPGSSNLWRVRRGSATRAFAAGTGGVFRSDDAGKTWTHLPADTREVRALAVDPSNPDVVYAGSWDAEGGVFVSRDGGASWAPSSQGLPERAGVAALAVDPRNSRRVAAATYWYGVYLSQDAGATWTAGPSGMPATARERLDDVAFSLDGVLYAASHHGVFAFGAARVAGVKKSEPGKPLPATGVTDSDLAGLLLAAAAALAAWRRRDAAPPA